MKKVLLIFLSIIFVQVSYAATFTIKNTSGGNMRVLIFSKAYSGPDHPAEWDLIANGQSKSYSTGVYAVHGINWSLDVPGNKRIYMSGIEINRTVLNGEFEIKGVNGAYSYNFGLFGKGSGIASFKG